MPQSVTAEMARQYRDIIITVMRTVDKRVVEVEENKSWERLMIHAVSLVQYMHNGTESLQIMPEEFEAEKEGTAIRTHVSQWTNPGFIRERRQKGEIAATSVFFVVKRSLPGQSLIRKGIKAAGVWY
jgi:hypothetical protein